MENQLPAGQVTIADLYRELVGMRTDMAKALTKIEVIDARNTAADKTDGDHELRIRALEAFRWKFAGIYAAIGLACGLLSGYLAWVLEHGRLPAQHHRPDEVKLPEHQPCQHQDDYHHRSEKAVPHAHHP